MQFIATYARDYPDRRARSLGTVTKPSRVYGGVSAEDRRTDRHARLVEAGLELVSRDGWTGVTVRGVCAQAGLTERYFYESFGDRDELLLAAFDRVAAEAAAGVLAAVEAAPHDARAKSRAAVGAFVEMLTEDPRRARAMLVESMASPALRERRAAAVREFAALMSERGREFLGADAMSERDSELTALALVGGLAELVVAWLEGRLDVSRERLVEHYAALFVAASSVSSERSRSPKGEAESGRLRSRSPKGRSGGAPPLRHRT